MLLCSEISYGFSRTRKKVLDLLQKDRFMSAMGISVIIGKMPGTIQRVFESLRRKGLINRIGSNKSGYWEVLLRCRKFANPKMIIYATLLA